jgi:hypothetical protein
MWTPARPPGPSATFSADLQTGDIVRVTGSPDGNRAVVIGGSGDQVRVRFESGVETEVGIESILRFTGNHPRGGNGFLYGAAAGALVGTASYLFEDDSSEEASAGVTAAGVLLLSALGAAIGASVTAQPVPTWSMPGAVEPPTLSIRPLVTRDRFGLMGRLSF